MRNFPAQGVATPKQVADLQADVGDASAGTLGSLYAILGNPAQTVLAMLGYEGATALANKLTAARAVLLDQITAARMGELDAANIPADVDNLKARLVPYMDFWSDVEDKITIPGAAADLTFPSVVVAGIPAGATLLRVICMLKVRAIKDTSAAANYIDQASKTLRVKKSTGAWGTDDVVAIDFDINQWYVAASAKEGGDVMIGDNDVKSEVDGNATYNFQSNQTNRADAISALANNLELYDVQTGIRVYFTV